MPIRAAARLPVSAPPATNLKWHARTNRDRRVQAGATVASQSATNPARRLPVLNPKQVKGAKTRRKAPLSGPTLLSADATRDIAGALNALLADVFALYVKTKNFHWHVSGPHFRDFHLLLDEQADQIYGISDPIAERVRKIGATTLRSIGHIAKLQRVLDNNADYVTPFDMLAELREDNVQLASSMRQTHELCSEHNDMATTSLLEVWIDEAERRTWFLFEAGRPVEPTGHT
jgi:starvation-inducible DNA-binding protein